MAVTEDPDEAALRVAGRVFARLAEARVRLGGPAAEAIQKLEQQGRALSANHAFGLAVVGDDAGERARLLNRVLGAEVCDPGREGVAGARARFRHGAALELHARFADGRVELFSEQLPDRSAELSAGFVALHQGVLERKPRLAAAEAKAQAAAQAHARAEEALAAAEAGVARARLAADEAIAARSRVERAAGEVDDALAGKRSMVPAWAARRPPWWAVWAWLWRLLFGRRYRARLSSVADLDGRRGALESRRVEVDGQIAGGEAQVAAALEARVQAVKAREQSARELASARAAATRLRAEIDELEVDLERVRKRGAEHEAERRERFLTAVRAATDARARAEAITELDVELPWLPEDLVVFDAQSRGHALDLARGWKRLGEEADGFVWAGAGEPPREALVLFGAPLPLPQASGEAQAAALRARLRHARALRLVRLAEQARLVGVDAIDLLRARNQEALARALERVDGRRIADVDEHVREHLARRAGEEGSAVRQAIEAAGAALEAELARLRQRWHAELEAAAGLTELRGAATRIGQEAPASIRVAEGLVGQRFVAALVGHAAALAQSLVRDLPGDEAPPPLGQPAPEALAQLVPVFPAPPPLELAPAGSWTARLRSHAAVRGDCIAALDAHLERAQRGAAAALLECEPGARRGLGELAASLARAGLRGREQELDRLAAATRERAERDPVRETERVLRRDFETLRVELVRAEHSLVAALRR